MATKKLKTEGKANSSSNHKKKLTRVSKVKGGGVVATDSKGNPLSKKPQSRKKAASQVAAVRYSQGKPMGK